MLKTLSFTVAAASLLMTACMPPEPPAPRRYGPDTPYPAPSPDPYGQPVDPRATPEPNPPQTPDPPNAPGKYPTAQFTANPNEVVSPYPPYNLIDIEGFKSGQLARDPSNEKIFRVP